MLTMKGNPVLITNILCDGHFHISFDFLCKLGVQELLSLSYRGSKCIGHTAAEAPDFYCLIILYFFFFDETPTCNSLFSSGKEEMEKQYINSET